MALTNHDGWDFFVALGSKPLGLVLIRGIFGYDEAVARNLAAAGFTGGHNPDAAKDAREKTVGLLSQVAEN